MSEEIADKYKALYNEMYDIRDLDAWDNIYQTLWTDKKVTERFIFEAVALDNGFAMRAVSKNTDKYTIFFNLTDKKIKDILPLSDNITTFDLPEILEYCFENLKLKAATPDPEKRVSHVLAIKDALEVFFKKLLVSKDSKECQTIVSYFKDINKLMAQLMLFFKRTAVEIEFVTYADYSGGKKINIQAKPIVESITKPVEQTKQPELPLSKAIEVAKVAETKPIEVVKPAEVVKPTEVTKPVSDDTANLISQESSNCVKLTASVGDVIIVLKCMVIGKEFEHIENVEPVASILHGIATKFGTFHWGTGNPVSNSKLTPWNCLQEELTRALKEGRFNLEPGVYFSQPYGPLHDWLMVNFKKLNAIIIAGV
jgi:hypothetical protein